MIEKFLGYREWVARLRAFWRWGVKARIGTLMFHTGAWLIYHSHKFQKRYTMTNNNYHPESRYHPPVENRY